MFSNARITTKRTTRIDTSGLFDTSTPRTKTRRFGTRRSERVRSKLLANCLSEQVSHLNVETACRDQNPKAKRTRNFEIMNKTRSFATQCESRRNTGVQTKRLSKDEMRYYANVIEKEKQVLLKFLEATKDQSGMLPRYKINMLPMQAKVMKNYGAKKRQKRKNKRKHSSLKIKHGASQNSDISRQVGENVGNRAHYVSKIVVDDDTRSLKLRFKSCNPRKSSSATEFKENERRMKGEERARSRKAKQPRRVCRVNEFQPDVLTTTTTNEKPTKFPEPRLGTLSPVQLHMSPKRISQAEKPVIKPAPSVKSDCPFASTNSSHRKQTTSMFTPSHSEDEHLSPSRITIKQEGKESEDCFQSIHSRPKRPDPVLAPTPPDDDTWNGHETTANSDDEQSDCSECSEEFSIVEPRDENATKLNESDALNTTDYKSPSDEETTTRKSDASMRDELKKRLKANLIRKQFDDNNNHHHHHNNHHHNNNNQHHKITNSAGEIHPGSKVRVEETEGLPQVVSVHFYDSHNQCQRVIDPNTPISQYARSDSTHLMLDDPISPSNSLSSLHPTGVTSHDSFNQRRSSLSPLGSLVPLTHPQATLPNIRPMQYRYPPYYHHATGMSKQPTTVTYANNLQNNTTSASYQPSYLPQAVSPNIPPGLPKTPPATSPSGSIPVSTPTSTISPTPHTGREQEKAGSPNIAGNSEAESGSRAAKRKRFIFGSHEPPKKKVISSLLTPLCEREATRLADGIHEINMQYFPLRSLAQKAANRVSEDTDDVLKLIEQKIQLKTKVQDVEKARNLLKDIYDMVLKSKEIEDIQNFELVSHNFGVRNILNHLSLVDLYFGELGTELQSKI